MTSKTVCILGGTGFVGQHLAARLTRAGYRCIIPSRHRERHRDLLVLPNVEVVTADIHDPATLARLFQGCSAVINLVAVINETTRGDFERIHVELPLKIVAACHAAGVKRLLHMSTLNADAGKGASQYLRSKGAGENIAHQATDLHVTSFRPSVIFGPGDHLFNRFACLLRALPILPLACPDSRLAPVYVGDVVEAMARALDNKATFGQRYDLCGPHSYTLRQIVEITGRVIRRRRSIIALGDGLSALQARLLGLLPGKLMTYDNYLSLKTPAVCTGGFPAVFGITPVTVESVVPLYLGHADQRGRYDGFRQNAARD